MSQRLCHAIITDQGPHHKEVCGRPISRNGRTGLCRQHAALQAQERRAGEHRPQSGWSGVRLNERPEPWNDKEAS